MDVNELKKIVVIQMYVMENFSDADWINLGQLTNSYEDVVNHPRLLRSMHNSDDDYRYNVTDVINKVCSKATNNIETIIDFYDIDLWYEQKDRVKYERIFSNTIKGTAQFWKPGYLKIFISHLATSKDKAIALKESLSIWGMSSFVAHQDIEPTKEWMTEIELGLNTMDILIAMVEPGFKESNWTDQEVGYSLGRHVEIIPLRIGADPHGFLGKYQGIQAKGRFAPALAKEILTILLKKPKIRAKLVSAFNLSLSATESSIKTIKLREIEALNLLNQIEMKEIIEGTNLTSHERKSLNDLIVKYKAFKSETEIPVSVTDLPF